MSALSEDEDDVKKLATVLSIDALKGKRGENSVSVDGKKRVDSIRKGPIGESGRDEYRSGRKGPIGESGRDRDRDYFSEELFQQIMLRLDSLEARLLRLETASRPPPYSHNDAVGSYH